MIVAIIMLPYFGVSIFVCVCVWLLLFVCLFFYLFFHLVINLFCWVLEPSVSIIIMERSVVSSAFTTLSFSKVYMIDLIICSFSSVLIAVGCLYIFTWFTLMDVWMSLRLPYFLPLRALAHTHTGLNCDKYDFANHWPHLFTLFFDVSITCR